MRVDGSTLAYIARARFDGPRLFLQGQLERETYLKVAKALTAASGKWTKAGKRIEEGWFQFPEDAADALEGLLLTGEITSEKRAFDVFLTPAILADEVADMADIHQGLEVLEPSAGEGALAWAADARGARVTCIEVRPAAADKLALSFVTHCGDFLEVSPAMFPRFDRVLMNPPFSRRQDIAHVRHAWEFVRPGGKLVAIMPPSYQFRQDGAARDFRAWLQGLPSMAVPNPPGAFKASGTSVATLALVVKKPDDPS